LNSPRLPAAAIGLLDSCPDFIGMEGHRLSAHRRDQQNGGHGADRCPGEDATTRQIGDRDVGFKLVVSIHSIESWTVVS
jgi:hypothetical protein